MCLRRQQQEGSVWMLTIETSPAFSMAGDEAKRRTNSLIMPFTKISERFLGQSEWSRCFLACQGGSRKDCRGMNSNMSTPDESVPIDHGDIWR